jgi:hypothetical protein
METVMSLQSERERHYRIVAIVHIVYACLGFLCGLVGATLLLGLSALPGLSGHSMSESVILRVLGILALAVTVLTTFPAFVGGVGLLKRQPWARILLLVVAVFDLVSFPIGTAIGVYTLWALWEPIEWRRG